ncbi:MAG: heavy-metal-associated domain-containing protein [Sporichthyaceae bacterium]
MSTLVLAVTGMHCGSCGMLIDEAVEDLPGVRSSSTDMRAERTTVDLDGSGATPSDVIAAIVAEGYTAVLVAP